ncbi:MAG: universal stress protein [Myxococcota bacterium]
MFSIEHIFVPLDYSPSSHAALQLALDFGAPAPSIQLVHFMDPWPKHLERMMWPFAAMGEDAPEFEIEQREHALGLLEQVYALGGVPHDRFGAPHIVRTGDVKRALPEALRTSGAELVVMGAFGSTGPTPGAIGSVAARMMRTSVRPVLLARDFGGAPSISRILCALDLSATSSSVLDTALSVAAHLGAELHVVYVLPDPLAMDANDLLAQNLKFHPDKALARSRDKIGALLDHAFASIDVPFPHRVAADAMKRARHIAFGDPAPTILAHADSMDADLVVVGSRDVSSDTDQAVGRVAWQVACGATTHVLLAPVHRHASILNAES